MPHIRSRFPRLYRLAVLLGLLAMLVPTSASLVHYTSAPQFFVRICGIDQHSDGERSKVPAHKLPSCPLCQSLHLVGAGIAPAVSSHTARLPVVVQAFVGTSISLYGAIRLAPQARPRAPPATI